jgi:hypothetical protein
MRPVLPRLIPLLWLLLAGSASAAVMQLQLAALARVDQPPVIAFFSPMLIADTPPSDQPPSTASTTPVT